MLHVNLQTVLTQYTENLAKNKNAALIKSAKDKITAATLLSIKEYDALISFLSSLIKDEQDQSKKTFLNETKALAQQQGNSLVAEHYIETNGRMPNASLLVCFVDRDTNVPYTVMIRNDKFKQFSSPAGKVDKTDVVTHPNGAVDLDKTFQNAAVREYCEEALNEAGRIEFVLLVSNTSVAFNTIDRDLYGIPEANTDFDTRLLTLDLGVQSAAEIQKWLKAPQPTNADAAEAFLQNANELAYAKLQAVADGKYTKHILTRKDATGADVSMAVRPTTLVVLNGPVDKPELGFTRTIGARSRASTSYATNSLVSAPQAAATPSNPEVTARNRM